MKIQLMSMQRNITYFNRYLKPEMNKLFLIITTFILLTSCTVISSQRQLYEGLTEPTALEDIPFLKIHYLGFIEAGKQCAERAGFPRWIHPVFVQIYGCSDVRHVNGKIVYCDVIIGAEFVLEHELRHCQGYDD